MKLNCKSGFWCKSASRRTTCKEPLRRRARGVGLVALKLEDRGFSQSSLMPPPLSPPPYPARCPKVLQEFNMLLILVLRLRLKRCREREQNGDTPTPPPPPPPRPPTHTYLRPTDQRAFFPLTQRRRREMLLSTERQRMQRRDQGPALSGPRRVPFSAGWRGGLIHRPDKAALFACNKRCRGQPREEWWL